MISQIRTINRRPNLATLVHKLCGTLKTLYAAPVIIKNNQIIVNIVT